MIERAGWAALAAMVAMGAEATPVFAAGETHDEAGALFEQARDLMGQGLFGDACPKLARSLELAPTGRTKLALAMCHEGEGRLATALGEFADAVAQATADGRADRVGLAGDHARAIEARISRVTLVVGDADGISVTLDATPIDRARWGTPIPVDGGAHVVRASAAGRRSWESTIRVASSGEAPRVEIPPLVPVGVLEPVPLASIDAAPKKRGIPVSTWIVGGVGLAAVGVGTYFGVTALDKQSDAGPYCTGSACQPAGVDLVNDARTRAQVADAAFGAGALALGVAVYLFTRAVLASPERPPRSLSSLPSGVATMEW
jgi:hypothetical protein